MGALSEAFELGVSVAKEAANSNKNKTENRRGKKNLCRNIALKFSTSD